MPLAPRPTLLACLPLAALFPLAACTGAKEECGGEGTGTLTVQISGTNLPTFTDKPAVLLYDPDGTYLQALEDTTTLSDLPAGIYTLAVRRGLVSATTSEPTGSAYGVLTDTVQEICVPADGEADVTVQIAEQPSSAHLWVTSGERVAGFAEGDLLGEGDISADLTLDISPTNDLRGLLFDAFGDLWVATSPTYGARLLVFEPGSLDAHGAVEADFTLAPDVFAPNAQIAALAFDSTGNLWIGLRGDDSAFVGLLKYTAAQTLMALTGGDPGEPRVVTVDGLVTPTDITFAGNGDLWITDDGSSLVLGIPGSSLASDAAAPTVRLAGIYDNDGVSGAYSVPTDLVFTADGTLWVNYWASAAIVGFAAGDLDGEHLPDEAVDAGTLSLPSGLVRDATDDLWYGNEPQDGFGELVHVNTVTTGTSLVLRTADATSPTDLLFDPAP